MLRKYNPYEDDVLIFRVAQLFFEGKSVTQIAEQINREMDLQKPLTRESVYPLLAKARPCGFIRLIPPLEQALTQEIANRFMFSPSDICVVKTSDERSNEFVAAAAAEIALNLIKELGLKQKEPVGVGLGPGRATLDFSKHLGQLLRSDPNVPKLKLFAICAGCPPLFPEYAPISFFNLFPPHAIAGRVGLFSEVLIQTRDFKAIKSQPGVREAFAERDNISLVVTSMGDFDDDHDLLKMFLQQSDVNLEELRNNGWIGNVQYRPYSTSGPIIERRDQKRAVTLFEVDDFVNMAKQKDKHVLLIAHQCGTCGRSRAVPLRPLLEVASLRVFSKLILDVPTATELLNADERQKRTTT